MGNVGGKEDGENGREEAIGRVESVESMENGGSPRRSRSPLLFAPQVPLAPLQGTVVPSVFYDTWMEPDESLDLPQEKAIPTLITWNQGGNDVVVEGSWDNWALRKTLQKAGKDHNILLVLPSGVYHYRFIVDGEWRYLPDLPHIADETGHFCNLLDVTDYVPEILDSIVEFEEPLSPDSSYSHPFPEDGDYAKEPPAAPQQLHLSVLATENKEDAPIRPQHAVLNHLFIEKGGDSRSLVALGLTHRFQSKYVTVVLYKPLRR